MTTMTTTTTSHADLFALLSRLLPDEALLYHSPLPRSRRYDPSLSSFVAERLILSLTPTQEVYQLLQSNKQHHKNTRCAVLLHRPFQLDRLRVPHGTVVFASHKRFDELYTVGYNIALADEHDVSRAENDRRCFKGYKNDPERKIGLLGRLVQPRKVQEYTTELSQAFEGHDLLHIVHDRPSNEASNEAQRLVGAIPASPSGNIVALLCLNAFTPDILARALAEARSMELRNDEILCLTGARREAGIKQAQSLGLNILAVGHKRCEVWGMRYVERQCRLAFPNLDIVLVDEPEE